ncbi:IS1096 element passenger TnpR family protein [Alloscardovia macacae]|uniref:Plasmid pRiA4b ORF-3-like family protein n=1 Tax=Alloscardovia macacae TaxID=1160091 RepID=A0A261F5M1_9BIFI|nr:hypothetical protein [Alloscardovia macacae]OZG54388.1 plasmid pRiA4b ORF-3-like family protein [Alloscardovia macacae]
MTRMTIEELAEHMLTGKEIPFDEMTPEEMRELHAELKKANAKRKEEMDLQAAQKAEDERLFEQTLATYPAFAALVKPQARLLYDYGFRTLEDLQKATRTDLLNLQGIGQGTITRLKNAGVEFAKRSQLPKNSWEIYVMWKGQGRTVTRFISVPKSASLAQLADIILWGYDFENDHAHAFFMDGQPWSKNAYFTQAMHGEGLKGLGPATQEVSLEGLQLNDTFLMLFDFGAEWRFTCKVSGERFSGDPAKVQMIMWTGQSPQQYPDEY